MPSIEIRMMLQTNSGQTEAGYAIVYYKNEELFTVSFMKGKEGEIWKHQIMDETKDPTIH